ncbi:MAG TPA: hypothetical protein VD996_12995, partial [Chitinophagaceae bacterium]|nr:hypothetical protein [Chitinophagaceae bacterium]
MKFTVTLFVALILNLLSHAQSLRGKVVYISANQEVKLKFRSPIDNYSFVNKPESNRFSIKLSGSRNIVVNSATSNAKPASFVITEGENTHLFILQYKNKLDASELVYDYSSKEKLLSESQKLARGIKGVPEKDRFVNYVTNTSDYTTSNAVNTNDTSAL